MGKKNAALRLCTNNIYGPLSEKKTKRLIQIFKLAKSIIQIPKLVTKCPQLNELLDELICQNTMFKNPPS